MPTLTTALPGEPHRVVTTALPSSFDSLAFEERVDLLEALHALEIESALAVERLISRGIDGRAATRILLEPLYTEAVQEASGAAAYKAAVKVFTEAVKLTGVQRFEVQ